MTERRPAVVDMFAPSQRFTAPEHRTDLMLLPSGDWIDPVDVSAIRISAAANKKTGEVGATMHICATGSWYSIAFSDHDVAATFAAALADYRNHHRRPPEARAAGVSRQDALSMINGLRIRGGSAIDANDD